MELRRDLCDADDPEERAGALCDEALPGTDHVLRTGLGGGPGMKRCES